jgi:uncharacterized protein (TIGR00661 family)
MKIFYAVQATGNGHISRAMELVPQLQQYGIVDIFLSGDNSNLEIDLPVKYRSKGLSLYYNCSGGLNYRKIISKLHPLRLKKEINDLPVEKYDLVINDFEFITSVACRKKKVLSIQLGHQASFQSDLSPRPDNKNYIGEWILKNYAKATHYIGLHFDRYDDFILPPVIKKEILRAAPVDEGHITVYLPSWCEHVLEKIFLPFSGLHFHVFSKETKQVHRKQNITFLPVNKQLFNESFITCHAIITGAGFETPAEALCLKKKLMCIPIRGQYEQLCNAAALEKMGITCLEKIDASFHLTLERWLETKTPACADYNGSIPEIIDQVFSIHEKNSQNQTELSFPVVGLQELLKPYIPA